MVLACLLSSLDNQEFQKNISKKVAQRLDRRQVIVYLYFIIKHKTKTIMKTRNFKNQNPINAKTAIANHFAAGALTVKVNSSLTTLTIAQQGDFYQVWVNGGTVQNVDNIAGHLDLLQGDISVSATYPN